jgi:predicted dehydrogenase
MQHVRLGIIGCGVIGEYHLRAAMAASHIRVTALADVRVELAQRTAQEFGITKFYADGSALLNDADVDAVVLALPTAVRFDLAIQALRLGKHVLLEKPAAMNANQLRQMIEARGDRVVACCSARNRFLESARVATEVVQSGALGEIRVVHCRCIDPAGPKPQSPPPLWRLSRALNGGGLFVNWGSYDLDYLLGICGWHLRPQLVLAQTWSPAPALRDHVAPGSDAETHVAAMIRCAGGAVIHYERGELTSCAATESWAIVGTKATLRLHMNPAKNNRVILDKIESDGVKTSILWEGDETDQTVHAGPVTDFATAIQTGTQPRTNLEQALVLQSIFDAAYQSAASGRAIAIDEENIA